MPPRPQRCGSPAPWGPVPCWRGARAWRGLVRAAGVEPAWAKARAILSRQCLPFHHARFSRRANLRPKRGFRRGDASADRRIWQCRGGAFMSASSRPAHCADKVRRRAQSVLARRKISRSWVAEHIGSVTCACSGIRSSKGSGFPSHPSRLRVHRWINFFA